MFDTYSRFSSVPGNPIQRSRFSDSPKHFTTFNFGDLVPVFHKYLLPGETFSLDSSATVRMSTPIYPVMGDAFLDLCFFAVPLRILWDHWEAFNGANEDSPWYQPVTYTIPQVTIPSGGYVKGTVADHFGVPLNNNLANNETISDLPFRAYAKIWNDWFRDENIDNPTYFTRQDATLTGSNTGSAVYGGKLCKVNKFHDMFTSCLPSPQKSPAPVTIGLAGIAPVDYSLTPHSISHSMTFSSAAGTSVSSGSYGLGFKGNGSSSGLLASSISSSSSWNGPVVSIDNAIVDLSSASGITVNDLRLAVATQRIFERLARSGSRMTEILQAAYGVQPQDARVQRSEYIGGKRFPISIQQVVQTSETSSDQLGTTGAYSLTMTGRNNLFTYSAQEHMIVVGVACARTRHSYSQGLNKWWSMKERFSFYDPALAHIGEQPVKGKELYFGDAIADVTWNESAFGYQEAWYQYRYIPDTVSGSFRPTGSPGLDSWLFTDYYSSHPTLSESWLGEGTANVDRTLAVQSSTSDQLIARFDFPYSSVVPMPLYSVPGLLDHF